MRGSKEYPPRYVPLSFNAANMILFWLAVVGSWEILNW